LRAAGSIRAGKQETPLLALRRPIYRRTMS
jgi:hypothetical protein